MSFWESFGSELASRLTADNELAHDEGLRREMEQHCRQILRIHAASPWTSQSAIDEYLSKLSIREIQVLLAYYASTIRAVREMLSNEAEYDFTEQRELSSMRSQLQGTLDWIKRHRHSRA